MLLPRDLIEEIEHELRTCSHQLATDSHRAEALIELHAEATTAATRIGRPLTLFAYIAAATDAHERARRAAQLRHLRATD